MGRGSVLTFQSHLFGLVIEVMRGSDMKGLSYIFIGDIGNRFGCSGEYGRAVFPANGQEKGWKK